MDEQKCLSPMSRETILGACEAYLEGDICTREDVLEIIQVIETHDLLTDDEIYPAYIGMLRFLEHCGGI